MRLLNMDIMELESFGNAENRPPYAILSHTWGVGDEEKEIVFEEWNAQMQKKLLSAMAPPAMNDGTGSLCGDSKMSDMSEPEPTAGTHAHHKIVGFCQKARSMKLKYGWIDTICIDKRSSAELSEAINSMWKYYRCSKLCMVYLHEDGDHVGSQLEIARSHKGWKDWRARKDTYKLRWLHRGWTLQELLAPHNVLFFAGEWEYIGSRSSLARDLQAMTGINYEHIRDGYVHSNEVLVSERLSWAVGRETTREEDHAYSLMKEPLHQGLFGVYMPVIYGEGAKNAVHRLQVEIFSATGDYSIFAWNITSSTSESLFATEIDSFASADPHFSKMASHYEFRKHWDRIPRGLQERGLSAYLTGVQLELAMRPLVHPSTMFTNSQIAKFYEVNLPVPCIYYQVPGQQMRPATIILEAKSKSLNDFQRKHDSTLAHLQRFSYGRMKIIPSRISSSLMLNLEEFMIREVIIPSRLTPTECDSYTPHHIVEWVCSLVVPISWLMTESTCTFWSKSNPVISLQDYELDHDWSSRWRMCWGSATLKQISTPSRARMTCSQFFDEGLREGFKVTYDFPINQNDGRIHVQSITTRSTPGASLADVGDPHFGYYRYHEDIEEVHHISVSLRKPKIYAIQLPHSKRFIWIDVRLAPGLEFTKYMGVMTSHVEISML